MKSFRFIPHFTSSQLSSIQIINRNAVRFLTQSQNSEWTETPEYPPIKDLSNAARRFDRKKEWWNKITSLPTIEQKLMEMNMPRFYGHFSLILSDRTPKLNGLEFIRYVTRSHIVENIPNEYYDDVNNDTEVATKSICDKVEDIIALHFGDNVSRVLRPSDSPNKIRTGNFIRNLNSIILEHFAQNKNHVYNLEADNNPRVEGAWMVGGFVPHNNIVKARENDPLTYIDPEEPVDRWIRSSVNPRLALRSSNPLPNVVDRDDPLAMRDDMTVAIQPNSYGVPFGEKRAVITPGFWPGCENEHGHLFYHTREILKTTCHKITDPLFLKEALDQSLLLSAFTQAHSYAFYQGFTPFNELLFPIVQQLISTDGQNYKFGLFQLNTNCLVHDGATMNTHNNIFWMTEDFQLFEAVEDGKVRGFNESVIKNIVKMYLKEGVARSEAYPFESYGYKYLKDHCASEEFKDHFHKRVLHLLSERPPGRLRPTINQWEKIYHLYFETRHMERKNRFFNSRNEWKPHQRKLDDYHPQYVPKDIRHNKKIKHQPKVDTENLFKLSTLDVRRARLRKGDPEWNSMNQKEPRYTRRSFMKYMTQKKEL